MTSQILDGYHIESGGDISGRQAQAIVDLLRREAPPAIPGLEGRSAPIRGHIDGIGAVVVKSYRRGGIIRHVNRRRYLKLGKTRGEREYEMLALARRAGIGTPEPLAHVRRGRGLYLAWLLTREIAGARSLAEVSRQEPQQLPRLAAAVADLVRRLIQAGIRHADLHPGNVLVDPEGQVYLVDFDKSRLFSGAPLRLWAGYRRRWNRAVAKHRLSPGLAEMLPADREENQRRFPGALPPPVGAADPSILIILMGSLGDVARGLSLVAPLKAHFPQSRLTWLVEPKCAALVQMHPLIDEVLVFERRWHPTPVRDLARALRRRHFDIALDLQRHLKSGFFSRLSRARRRIGFHRQNAKELNWLFNNEHIPACPESLPKIRHYLKFVEALGAAAPPQLDFGLGHVETGGAPPQIRALSRPFIAVALGSSWPSKDWHAEGYRTLIDRILAPGKLAVVLTGDGSQVPLAAGLVSALNQPDLIDLTGKTTIPQLAAVLKAARAAAGPDCGSAHLAAAVGTPYVSLFGPTDPSRTAPHGGEQLVVRNPTDCAPCYRKRCPISGHPCMRGIEIDAVVNLLESIVSKTGAPLNNGLEIELTPSGKSPLPLFAKEG